MYKLSCLADRGSKHMNNLPEANHSLNVSSLKNKQNKGKHHVLSTLSNCFNFSCFMGEGKLKRMQSKSSLSKNLNLRAQSNAQDVLHSFIGIEQAERHLCTTPCPPAFMWVFSQRWFNRRCSLNYFSTITVRLTIYHKMSSQHGILFDKGRTNSFTSAMSASGLLFCLNTE